MALNEIYKVASELVFPVNSAVVSGDLVQVGEVVGVAQQDAITGEDGNTYATLKLDGVFAFDETSGSTLAVGDVAYGTAAATGIIASVDDVNTGKVLGHVTKVGSSQIHVRLIQSA